MNRREKIIINSMFLIFTIPIIALILYGYTHVKQIVQKNPLNPVGLEVVDCKLEENEMVFILFNPKNISYSIVFTNLRARGDYAAPAIVTTGSFLNKVINIRENSEIILTYSIPQSNINLLNIIRTWKKLGGSITISLDYEILPAGGSGVLICKK